MKHAHDMTDLNTDFVEPLYALERQMLAKRKVIHDWFQNEWLKTVPPVYGSVDLRNAGFKVAPIDMNLFPAGFNNLNPNYLTHAVSAAKKNIELLSDNTRGILLIPESHTRNLFYWSNVKILQTILETAGYHVHLGSLDPTVTEPLTITLESGDTLRIDPILKKDGVLSVADLTPDIIILNNDLSEGIPEILQHVKQPIIPPAKLGWSQRLKSEHFQFYAEVADEFAAAIDIDPWLIAPLFKQCGDVDFMQQSGMDCLVDHAEELFAAIRKKYAEYNIPHQPFLIIKADAGTYGMAVMTVRDPEELKSLNRKQRTRMSSTKGNQPVHKVIIQEGVYTFETWGEEKAVAEPVVYLWGDEVIGGFYRVHKDRGIDENLNAPGMQFQPIAFSHTCHEPSDTTEIDACCNRLYVYGIIASLSMLAAAREMKD